MDSAVDDSDSAVDDSNSSFVMLDGNELSTPGTGGLFEQIKSDSDKLSSIIENGKKILSELKDSTINDDKPEVIDDYLPGLDDDIKEEPQESTIPDESETTTNQQSSTSNSQSDATCTDDAVGYGEIKVVEKWGSYEADLPYYFFNVGWSLQHTNPSYQNNVNSMTVDMDITGFPGGPPSKTVRTNGDGNLEITWNTQSPGTYTFKIVNFQNMGSYCGDGDMITVTIP